MTDTPLALLPDEVLRPSEEVLEEDHGDDLSFPRPEGRGFPVKPPGHPVGFPVLGPA